MTLLETIYLITHNPLWSHKRPYTTFSTLLSKIGEVTLLALFCEARCTSSLKGQRGQDKQHKEHIQPYWSCVCIMNTFTFNLLYFNAFHFSTLFLSYFTLWLCFFYICTCDSLWCCLFHWQTPAVTNPSHSKLTRELQHPSIVHMRLQTRTTWSTSAEETWAPHVCSRRWSTLPASKVEGSGFRMTRGWRHSKWRLSAWSKQILGGTFVVCTETPAWMFSLPLTCKSKVSENDSSSSYRSKPLPYTCQMFERKVEPCTSFLIWPTKRLQCC